MSKIPAQCLLNEKLDNGWTVIDTITRKKNSTGGKFSVGYKVKNDDGREAFLKAIDFSSAMQKSDPLKELQKMLELYNFERDVLEKCKKNKLRRVMTPIDHGLVVIPGFAQFGAVHYLIFELADGDIRDILSEFSKIDLVFYLKSLHNIIVGIGQLHRSGIAHQDLKPSNVLYQNNDGSKIADLGRASDKIMPSPLDTLQIAGDQGYAPADLFYTDTGVQGHERKFLTDLYLFGSLIFFYFTNISAKQLLVSKLNNTQITNQSFKHDLPYLQYAFDESLNDLEHELRPIAGNLTDEIIEIARQLCDPDPTKRGDPSWRNSVVPNYDVQRYISKFDLLSRKAALIV